MTIPHICCPLFSSLLPPQLKNHVLCVSLRNRSDRRISTHFHFPQPPCNDAPTLSLSVEELSAPIYSNSYICLLDPTLSNLCTTIPPAAVSSSPSSPSFPSTLGTTCQQMAHWSLLILKKNKTNLPSPHILLWVLFFSSDPLCRKTPKRDVRTHSFVVVQLLSRV